MLTEGFNPEELRELAYDDPDFRPVYDQLSSSAGKAEIVQASSSTPSAGVKMEALLAWARERNPDRYNQYQPYSDSPIGSPRPATTPVTTPPVSTQVPPPPSPPSGGQWMLFICHASEDKPFVRTLAQALREKGLQVWYDELP